MPRPPLLQLLSQRVLYLTQRDFVSFPNGLFANLLLKEACDRHGVEGVEVVQGVCACPSDVYVTQFTAPHVWLVMEGDGSAVGGDAAAAPPPAPPGGAPTTPPAGGVEGDAPAAIAAARVSSWSAITDLEPGFWGPLFGAVGHSWYDQRVVYDELKAAAPSQNIDDLYEMYLTACDLHQAGFPFKCPLLAGRVLTPPVDGVQFFRWHYATGDEAAFLISDEAQPEEHAELAGQAKKLALGVKNRAVRLAMLKDLEPSYYRMAADLDKLAQQWQEGAFDDTNTAASWA